MSRPRSYRRRYRRARGSSLDPRLVAAVIGLVLVVAAVGKPTTPAAVAAPAAVEPAAPMKGTGTPGCVVPDPTSGGCLTRAAAHGLAEIGRVFGGIRKGPKIRAVSCWDEHAWNPTSDHPKGRACDIYTGAAKQFAAGPALANGNGAALPPAIPVGAGRA